MSLHAIFGQGSNVREGTFPSPKPACSAVTKVYSHNMISMHNKKADQPGQNHSVLSELTSAFALVL